ncbi:TadE/TadG family type IV pilus assembly protein [Isoptericola sp. BMS4]|uniref:TadE/TadG family type IV pilus assembly protein n=1 Tax=Isoptericola sp. BMS4 TaxID=2527875 RepID=UPI00141FF5FF|nr:TadE/TadG family type IV pilus assembly protein [Isoptericola sp. BMS4]
MRTAPRHARRRHARSVRDRERGSTSLELAVLAPALLVLLALIVVAGRVAVAHQAVDGAAAQAARAASLERTPGAAADRAHAVAAATLDNSGLHCTGTSVAVDTGGFAAPVGTPASVTATVTCTVDLSGLPVPGVGPQTITKTASSALDTYRER